MANAHYYIHKAFDDALLLAATATSLSTSRVETANTAFDPNAEGDSDAGTWWMRGTLIPDDVYPGTLGTNGGTNKVYGIYQIDVMWPRGEGSADVDQKAADLVDIFYRGRVLTADDGNHVHITRSSPGGSAWSAVSQV